MNYPGKKYINNVRSAKVKKIRAETVLIRKRTDALDTLSKSREKALGALMESVSAPKMSLNQELYGSVSQYSSDIWQNNTAQTRRISRIAYWESPEAQAMIGRFTDLVYGPRLELQSMPIWDIIPGAPADNEERQKIVKNIESRYRLWAKSKNSDYTLDKNHYQRSRSNFEKLMIDGEYFVILRYSSTRKRNPLTVQYINPDSVRRVDSNVSNGNTEIDGIEYNKKGQEVAYHIYNQTTNKSVRVPRFGPKSGRVFVIHNKLGDNLRGVSILAGIITELTKLADFQALEIQAAVINALFAVWVETEIGGQSKPVVSKGGVTTISTTQSTVRSAWDDSSFQADLDKTKFDGGGIIAQNLGEGQKLHSFDTKRPTANFEGFMKTVKRSLYSAKGMPVDVVDYDLEASYSAIRGQLLIFWNRVMTMRVDHSNDYEDVIYKMWMLGEIDNDNIKDFINNDETIHEAFTNAWWNGPPRPDIDPLRSAKAAEVDSFNSWKTDNQISAERGGGDFDENVKRKIIENKSKAEANEPLVVQEKTTYSNSNNITESTTKT